MVPNAEGTAVSWGSLQAGIYLDNGSGRFDVVNNMVHDIGVDRTYTGISGRGGSGIFLHSSDSNVVAGNRVWRVSRSSFKAQGEIPSTTAALTGNLVAANDFFGARILVPSADAPDVMIYQTIYTQEWVHSVSVEDMFSGPVANVAAGNRALAPDYTERSALWQTRSAGRGQTLTLDQWRTFAPTDTAARAGTFAAANLWRETALLANESEGVRSYLCSDLSLRACSVVGLDGRPLLWPINIPAAASAIVLTSP